MSVKYLIRGNEAAHFEPTANDRPDRFVLAFGKGNTLLGISPGIWVIFVIVVTLLINLAATNTGWTRVLYASPGGGTQIYNGQSVETSRLDDAVKDVLTDNEDTVIQLIPGHYDLGKIGSISITRHPDDKKPYGRIIIRGSGSGTVVDGARDPERNPAPKKLLADGGLLKDYLGVTDLKQIDPAVLARIPHINAFSCFRIENQQSIEIENMSMRNCWQMAVFAINSTYISLKNTTIIGSTYAFHAFGPRSHHFLLENNHWIQDASPRKRMWREICWSAVKGYVLDGQETIACPLEGRQVRDFAFFNGAFFGSWNIAGSVVIRRNQISNAFNGIRMDAPRGPQYDKRRNLNVEIYNNSFRYIRDNPIEPEATATNWWVHHNQIFNAHAWFSFDAVGGGEWYIFGNVGWFDERPYADCTNNPECKPCLEGPGCNLAWSGKVFKFLEKGPHPTLPAYVFNNSWYLRKAVAGKGMIRNLRHWNNAIEFCRPRTPDDGLCQATNRLTAPDAEICGTARGAPPLRLFGRGFKWRGDPRNNFDYDLSNQCWPAELTANGQESNAVVAAEGARIFEAPYKGDFRLPDDSPARNAGTIIEFRDRFNWTGAVEDGKPDIGAFEGRNPMRGPIFRHFNASGLYRERPRVVDVTWATVGERNKSNPQLRVTFSIEIDTLTNLNDPRVAVESDTGTFYKSDSCRASRETVICEFPSGLPFPPSQSVSISLPKGIRSIPQSGKRMPMTLWSSVHPDISIR